VMYDKTDDLPGEDLHLEEEARLSPIERSEVQQLFQAVVETASAGQSLYRP